CQICGVDVAGTDRQNHMGKHILCYLRNILTIAQVSSSYPCGFCGKSTSNGGCTLSIRSGKANSSCSEVYEFQIAAASKLSISKPCTNVPVRCPL
ncbi:hypothetical protein R3P38DRAFT_2399199, partial [Favolaschia claudopus]